MQWHATKRGGAKTKGTTCKAKQKARLKVYVVEQTQLRNDTLFLNGEDPVARVREHASG
jgi:hypothetical protein